MKLLETLEKQLKKEPNFFSDNGELKKWVVLSKAQNMDEELISLLLENEELKAKFFIKIKDAKGENNFVFNLSQFSQFLEQKNYLNDSYTAYKNKIGLTIDGKFLKQRNEVALVWPFKDCILEGGQNKEEQKREEIFFNEILAQDEITQLLEPKVLTAAKKFTKDGEQDFKGFSRDEAGTIKDNLIIKGNNLLALHSLKKEFAGKVKLIYIDPPYNTEGSANTFAYNNSFNHSSWLTFMKNRLEVTKELLSENGSIVIAIDHAELFYVGTIADEIFERNNRIGLVAVETNPRGRADSKFFATSHEYFITYAKNPDLFNLNNFELTEEQKNIFKLKDEISQYRLLPLQRSGSNSTPDKRPKLRYPVYFDPANQVINLDKSSDNLIEIYPNDVSGAHKVWRISKDSFKDALSRNDILIKDVKGKYVVFMKDRIKEGRKAKTFWSNPLYDASSHGTVLLKQYFDSNVFSYPKSIHLVKDILKICANENDLVLDFFAGSGTTAHAVLELNKEDGGNRRFILCEQMDYVETVTSKRVQKVIENNQQGEFVYLELKKHRV